MSPAGGSGSGEKEFGQEKDCFGSGEVKDHNVGIRSLCYWVLFLTLKSAAFRSTTVFLPWLPRVRRISAV